MSDRRRVEIDPRTRLWGEFVTGGSPWRVSTLGPRALEYLRLLRQVGAVDVPEPLATSLLTRGLVHPCNDEKRNFHATVTAVIPVRNDEVGLRRALDSIPGIPAVVIDDASAQPLSLDRLIARPADRARVQLVRLDDNRGPAFARNLGASLTSSDLILFLDADCVAGPGWPMDYIESFADGNVLAVAPAIRVETSTRRSCEWAVDALFMGRHRDLVHPNGRLTFVPSASLLVRRQSFIEQQFDPAVRLGEDVDWLWRAVSDNRVVRYEPSVRVTHRERPSTSAWLGRIFQYGTSAPHLAERFPLYPAPTLPSPAGTALILSVVMGHPWIAIAIGSVQITLIRRRLPSIPGSTRVACYIALAGTAAEARSLVKLARREWWPLGLAACALATRAPAARRFIALALGFLAVDYVRDIRRPPVVQFVVGSIAADISYGWGVWTSSLARGTVRPLFRSRRRARQARKPSGTQHR